ncbi:hypothetical protein [Streptomyces sp. MMG1121]|uniref:hypothetical protein n=1 Tax=Streptomyces sp. MMG1121 TaxID=1415544 RepID=UPI000A788F68|nr:hypothetical protein [Streptomyces sp. MMG1121]
MAEHGGEGQEEMFTDLVDVAVGVILGRRGRGAPVAVPGAIAYELADEGIVAMLHHRP